LIKEGLNPELAIEGVLLTMADYRTNLTNEVINEIKSFFKEKVYDAVIPRNIKLSEAPSFGKPIMLYHGASIGAKKYLELAQEFLNRNGIFCNILELNNLQESLNGAPAEDMAEPTE